LGFRGGHDAIIHDIGQVGSIPTFPPLQAKDFNMDWTPIPSDSLKWLGVDFDLTIANNSGYPDFVPCEPLQGAKEALECFIRQGYRIVIHTARPWADYKNIEDWCLKYEIPFSKIVCGKILCKYYIDGRAIEFTNWADVRAKLF
jgi:hypothetical protein